jgi:hypothetical protein
MIDRIWHLWPVRHGTVCRLNHTRGAARGHFALLSGLHTDRFLAFSRIADDPAALQTIAGWLAPSIALLLPDALVAPSTAGVGLGWARPGNSVSRSISPFSMNRAARPGCTSRSSASSASRRWLRRLNAGRVLRAWDAAPFSLDRDVHGDSGPGAVSAFDLEVAAEGVDAFGGGGQADVSFAEGGDARASSKPIPSSLTVRRSV